MKLIFILLSSEAATEIEFTSSIKTAYQLYINQVKDLDNVIILDFKKFKRACMENNCIYQLENDNNFIDQLPHSNDISNVFAMRIVYDFRFKS